MKHVQNGLGLKIIKDRLRRSVQGIFESKSLTKEQRRQYIKIKNEINENLKDKKIKYCRNDIAEKIIKNCRGVGKSNDGVNRLDKENERENFIQLLGFKKNEVFESK